LTTPQACAFLAAPVFFELSHVQEASVTGKLRISLISALTIVALALGGGRALALSFDDIAGRWCGSVSSYTFTPSMLIVDFYADSTHREFPVNSYEYADDVITVNWERDGEKLFTKFGQFNADERTMAQQVNGAGPRREFRRCSQ
jgi:hypothetical protein